MTAEAYWILVGVGVGLAVVFAVYKLAGTSKGTAVASGAAVVLGGLAALLAVRRRPEEAEGASGPPPTTEDVEESVQPILDVAHEANDAAMDEETTAVDKALEGPSPEEELAALGDSRRRSDT